MLRREMATLKVRVPYKTLVVMREKTPKGMPFEVFWGALLAAKVEEAAPRLDSLPADLKRRG